MSRSHRHAPYAHFARRHKSMKCLSDKRVRHLGIGAAGNHGACRKANETWDGDRRVVDHASDHCRDLDAEGARLYRRAFLAK